MNLLSSGEIIQFKNVFAQMVPGTVWRVMDIKEDGSFVLERMKEFTFTGTSDRQIVSKDGVLDISFSERRITRDGKVVVMTTTEWKLLEVLINLDGKAVSHGAILTYCWGPEYAGDIQYLRVWISRLRSKLGEQHIITHGGYGYTFVLNPDEKVLA